MKVRRQFAAPPRETRFGVPALDTGRRRIPPHSPQVSWETLCVRKDTEKARFDSLAGSYAIRL